MLNPGLSEVYNNLFKEEFKPTDEEYFIYEADQEAANFSSIYFGSCLAVSDKGDATIVLLNSEIKFGEAWEAWMYAPWNSDPNRYKSFELLMMEEYKNYLEVINTEAKQFCSKHKKGRSHPVNDPSFTLLLTVITDAVFYRRFKEPEKIF